jgi:hypothetical protein
MNDTGGGAGDKEDAACLGSRLYRAISNTSLAACLVRCPDGQACLASRRQGPQLELAAALEHCASTRPFRATWDFTDSLRCLHEQLAGAELPPGVPDTGRSSPISMQAGL